MKNPFEFPDKYMSIGTNIKIEQIIEVSILEKYAAKLGVSVDILTQNINTYIGKGISFNLPNNEIIIGNNISLEITTNKIEMSKTRNIYFRKFVHISFSKHGKSTYIRYL